MAAASSSVILAAAAAGQRRSGAADKPGDHADKVRIYACSTRLSIPSGEAAPSHLFSSRNLACASASLFGDNAFVKVHQSHSTVFRVSQASSPAARAGVGTVTTKEPVTGIEFSRTLTVPGGSTELSFVGAGVREKKIAFVKVKVYAVGFYIDTSSLADSSFSSSWKGKSGSELSKDEAFFKALIGVPVEKALKIVLARDVEGSQFWGALDESLTPRLKTAGVAGQQALTSLGKVFKGLALKKGTAIVLTWSQPATLQVAISSVDGPFNSAAPNATIESAALLSSVFDIYLSKDSVSPSAAAAIANKFPSLL